MSRGRHEMTPEDRKLPRNAPRLLGTKGRTLRQIADENLARMRAGLPARFPQVVTKDEAEVAEKK